MTNLVTQHTFNGICSSKSTFLGKDLCIFMLIKRFHISPEGIGRKPCIEPFDIIKPICLVPPAYWQFMADLLNFCVVASIVTLAFLIPIPQFSANPSALSFLCLSVETKVFLGSGSYSLLLS